MTTQPEDKALEAELDKILPCDCSFTKGFAYKKGDPCDGTCVLAPYRRAVKQLIQTHTQKALADREVDIRIDELKKHEKIIFGNLDNRSIMQNSQINGDWIISEIDKRITKLKNSKKGIE